MAHSVAGQASGSGDLDDYLAEIQDIEQGRNPEEVPEDESKTPDEGEQELAWLKEIGFAHLASKYEEGRELEEDIIINETSSLTKAQADAVKKRIDTLNATIRKRSKQQNKQKTDVRNVFSGAAAASAGGRHHSDSVVTNTKASRHREPTPFMRTRGGYSVADSKPESLNVEALSFHSRDPQKRQAVSESCIDNMTSSLGDGSSAQKGKVRGPTSAPTVKHGLPNFIMKPDPLGMTTIDDLGKPDQAKIKSLALMELTSLFDIHNVQYTRRKAKRRLFKEQGIYGVPLQTLLDHDKKKHPNLKVPLFYKELMEYLCKTGVEEEGILRVPGSATRIKSLRQEIEEKFKSDKFHWEEVRPNDAAGLLKQFVRDLPIPLLTYDYLEAFAQVEKIPNHLERVQALNFLVLVLPDVHRSALKLLLDFLARVAEHGRNRMTVNNVAMIIAPNLFLMQAGRSKPKSVKEIEFAMAAGTSNIVKMMIQYREMMWSVQRPMLDQIRLQYDADAMKKSRDKSIMKLLGRKDKSDAYKKVSIHNEADFQKGIIRVKSTTRSKHSTPIQLDEKTTANDVICEYQKLAPLQPPESNGKESIPDDSFQSSDAEEIFPPKPPVQENSSLRTPKTSVTDYSFQALTTRRDSSGDELESCGSLTEMTLETTSLYEVGGNIGERRLDGLTNMMSLYRANPNTDWIIKTKPG